MSYKFTCFTVQHSGTRFLERYFLRIGLSPKRLTQPCRVCGESHGYEKHLSRKSMSGRYEYTWHHYGNQIKKPRHPDLLLEYEQYPIVSTLRHPHKTAISFLSRNQDLRTCLNEWENFIIQSRKPIVFFDVDCPEEHRKDHLLDVVRKVDCCDNETEKLTEEFVQEWKPIGVYNSDIKQEYERSGKLPDVFDWSRFDRAVNWYDSVVRKVRDNFTS